MQPVGLLIPVGSVLRVYRQLLSGHDRIAVDLDRRHAQARLQRALERLQAIIGVTSGPTV